MKLTSDKTQEQQGRRFLSFSCSAQEIEFLNTKSFQDALGDLWECKSGIRLYAPILINKDEVLIEVQQSMNGRMDNEFINFVLLCFRTKNLISSDLTNQIYSQVEQIIGKKSPLEKILPWMQKYHPGLVTEDFAIARVRPKV
ncbi:MAG: hypothetical protein JSR17_09700 [Proteobacteria bacterium]|nr:hypothetical protein [Pseudomonadota bacterium]